jgi:hypothetical protein
VTALHQSNPVQLLPHAQVYFGPGGQTTHGVLLALSEITVIHTRNMTSMRIAALCRTPAACPADAASIISKLALELGHAAGLGDGIGEARVMIAADS